MGITVGQPTGPIQLPDIAKNRLAYKEFGLKKRQLELQEKLAEQKINEQKRKSGKYTKPKISDAKPNFNEKFRPLHDELVSQLDNYYIQYADQLNPNNTADDDIPGVYDPKIHRFVQNYENSMLGFADHSNTWTTNANSFFDTMGGEGDQEMDLSLLEQHPVFLTVDRVNEKMNASSGYGSLEDPQIMSLWRGNEENGGKSQQLVLREGGDPTNINDYLTNNEGQLIDADGFPIIEHGPYGKFKQSNKYIVSDVFNQDISPSKLSVDVNGNITYGGKHYYDYFDVNMWDQGKYIKKEEINYIQNFAEDIDYEGLLQVDPGNPMKKIVTKDSFGNLRNQIINGYSWNQDLNKGSGGWNSESSDEIAWQVAGISLRMQGISSPSPGRLEDEFFKIMRNDLLPSGDNNLPRTSQYDGYEIKTYNDLVSELILEQFNGYKSFELYNSSSSVDSKNKRESTDWDNALSSPHEMAFDVYNILGAQIKTGYGGAPPQAVQSQIKQNQTWMPHQDLGTGSVNNQTYNRTGFITGSSEISEILNTTVGTFKSGNKVSLVPINRKTGQMMQGEWKEGNQQFVVSESYSKEQAELCILVPCYYGEFVLKQEDLDAIKANTPAEDLVEGSDLSVFLNGEGRVPVFTPIHRIHSKDTYEYHYGDYIDMAAGISNSGIYYQDKTTGQPVATDLTPNIGFKFPGGEFDIK